MTRSKYSFYNFLSGVVGTAIIAILGFFSRAVFIQTLGKEYLGINGLISSIVIMLSLTELGIGTAIIFNMYKPIAENDKHHIILLMKFYKKVYTAIGYIITVMGLCVLPFLPFFIKNVPADVNIYIIFLLYLLSTVSSYFFFAYKRSLLYVNQKSYLINISSNIISICTTLLQILLLLIFSNFILYIMIFIFSQIAQNFTVAYISDKKYPFIKEKTTDKLDRQEVKEIWKNSFASFLYKTNETVLNATDNIVISLFINIATVGFYSNYILITSGLKTFATKFFNAITAGVGNLNASETEENVMRIFRIVNFIVFWTFGVLSVGLFIVANEFIVLWIGKDYILPITFVITLSCELYIFGLLNFTATFRNTMGLFWQGRYAPLFGAVFNIILSIVFVHFFGITGVLLGTVLSNLLSLAWYDPYIIFKYGFKKTSVKYFLRNLGYFLIIIVSGAVCFLISTAIGLHGKTFILVNGMLSVLIPSIIIVSLFHSTFEFKYCLSIFTNFIKKA